MLWRILVMEGVKMTGFCLYTSLDLACMAWNYWLVLLVDHP